MSTYRPRGFKAIYHRTRHLAARSWFRLLKPVAIAVTGSQGKTNTVHILDKLFPHALRTDENLDTIYNVPITTLKLRPRHKLAIYELGIDSKQEMERHLKIVKPRISIITGIAPVHSDVEHLGSLENIILEKRKLIECLGPQDFAILNYDDINVRGMAPFTKAKMLFYGSHAAADSKCAVWTDANINSYPLEHVRITPRGTVFHIHYKGQTLALHTGLIGAHHISNIMAAFLAFITVRNEFSQAAVLPELVSLENQLAYFAKVIAALKPLPGRMSCEPGPLGSTLLNDSLRANPESAKAGLLTLAAMLDEHNGVITPFTGKKIAVLGEMGELGEMEVIKHRELGRLAAQINCDLLIGIGPLQKETVATAIQSGMPAANTFWTKDVNAAAQKLAATITPGDLIYLKGSLLRHLERIMLILSGVEVGCTVTSCPFYNHCSKCRYLKSGYQNITTH